MRSVRVSMTACVVVACAAIASAQPARMPSPEGRGMAMAQGFSVVLVMGDSQSNTIADNVPQAARKALADMKDFLPYRGYRLLDAQWILGSQRSSSRLRGPDDQEYQLTLRTTSLGGRINVTFQLAEPGTIAMSAREMEETAARRSAEADFRARLEQLQVSAAAAKERLGESNSSVRAMNAEIEAIRQRLAGAEAAPVARGRTVIDTTFSMDIGETVVVGTSRMRGGDKALIALLTAVPRGTK